MFDAISLTGKLALFTGIYMLAAAISLLFDPKPFTRIMEEFRANAGLSYVTGVMVFVLGAFIVAVHNIWTDPLAIVVSVIGWAALIEGVLFIAARRAFFSLVTLVPMTVTVLRGFGIVLFLFGAWMVFAALT